VVTMLLDLLNQCNCSDGEKRECLNAKCVFRNGYSDTALNIAISQGSANMAKELVAAGADITIVDGEGKTCLHAAVTGGNNEMLDYLLSLKRVDPDVRENVFGKTALHYAESSFEGLLRKAYKKEPKRNSLDVCRKMIEILLVKGKASLDVLDYEGKNIFHWIVLKNRLKGKVELLEAVIQSASHENKLFEALNQKSEGNYFRDFNSGKQGDTPFDLLLVKQYKYQCKDLMKVLLETRNKKSGKTLLQQAKEWECIDYHAECVVKKLEELQKLYDSMSK